MYCFLMTNFYLQKNVLALLSHFSFWARWVTRDQIYPTALNNSERKKKQNT